MARYGKRNFVVPSLGWQFTRVQKMHDQIDRLTATSWDFKQNKNRRTFI